MLVAYNAAKTIIKHPPVITIFIGGLTHSQITLNWVSITSSSFCPMFGKTDLGFREGAFPQYGTFTTRNRQRKMVSFMGCNQQKW
jgi:hypothetical protein